MTPKEKASDLWWWFYNRIEHTISNEYETSTKELCKLLATKVVDEIIESRTSDSVFDDTKLGIVTYHITPHPMYLSYWLKVKEEIEKI